MRAEEEAPELGWSHVAELSLVSTGGNAEAETFGFKDTSVKRMESSAFTLELGGLRAESTSRLAQGTADDFREVSVSTLTAENYYLRGRYDRDLGERMLWYVGAGWDKNTFAGIENRYYALVGIGHRWFDDETSRLRTDYGLTFTSQEDTLGVEDEFAGVRLAYDYWRQLTGSTDFGSVLIVDGNVDETDDLRADLTNWLGVSMSERLALRVSLQLLYDNLPALGSLPLIDEAGAPTGTEVVAELDELDSILTVALVVNF